MNSNDSPLPNKPISGFVTSPLLSRLHHLSEVTQVSSLPSQGVKRQRDPANVNTGCNHLPLTPSAPLNGQDVRKRLQCSQRHSQQQQQQQQQQIPFLVTPSANIISAPEPPLRRWACPFQKVFPKRETCGARAYGFSDVNRVKTHLKDAHDKTYLCKTCWKSFRTEMDPASALARHEAAGGCRSAPSPRSFWLDPAQLDQLNPTHRGDERYRYFALAKLVIKDFAHLSLDEIAQRITPYYEPPMSLGLPLDSLTSLTRQHDHVTPQSTPYPQQTTSCVVPMPGIDLGPEISPPLDETLDWWTVPDIEWPFSAQGEDPIPKIAPSYMPVSPSFHQTNSSPQDTSLASDSATTAANPCAGISDIVNDNSAAGLLEPVQTDCSAPPWDYRCLEDLSLPNIRQLQQKNSANVKVILDSKKIAQGLELKLRERHEKLVSSDEEVKGWLEDIAQMVPKLQRNLDHGDIG